MPVCRRLCLWYFASAVDAIHEGTRGKVAGDMQRLVERQRLNEFCDPDFWGHTSAGEIRHAETRLPPVEFKEEVSSFTASPGRLTYESELLRRNFWERYRPKVRAKPVKLVCQMHRPCCYQTLAGDLP